MRGIIFREIMYWIFVLLFIQMEGYNMEYIKKKTVIIGGKNGATFIFPYRTGNRDRKFR